MACCPAHPLQPVDDGTPIRASLPGPPWLSPPAGLTLPGDEVHVWRASLDLPASRVQELAQALSADERTRASRFRFERDRRRFIASHGILRAILGRYLDVEPARLQFCHGPYGKPALAETPNGSTLCFNMSHSHEFALYAITRNGEVGVDLENIRPVPDAEQIARRFFSGRENAAFQAVPTDLKHKVFFTCWVRKEAYVKARGDGLSLPLDQFDVSLTPGEPARLLDTRFDSQEASRWSLYDVTPGPGYVAAVAVQGPDCRLRCWEGAPELLSPGLLFSDVV